MRKKCTKKQITEAIAYWEKQLEKIEEVQHDGTHVPRRPTRRNETDKPTVYYIGIDEYSDNFSQYGHYVMPNGGLTRDASSSSFKSAGVTKVPATLRSMVEKTLAKYGKDHYIFVFKEEYSYGNQTHKRHARPAVIDIWYPKSQYWKYGFQPVEALSESNDVDIQHLDEATIDVPDSKISTSMDLVVETPGDNGVNIHIQTDEDGLDTVKEIISILKQGISTRFPKKVAGMEFVHFYAR